MKKSDLFKKSFTSAEVENLNKLTLDSNVAATAQIRKNEAILTEAEKNAFKDTVKQLVASGAYNKIVNIHEDMKHDMHGRMHGMISKTGVQRFLGWHRAYLIEVEKEFQKINPSVNIPYWQWTKNQSFPEWLSDLLPQSLTTLGGKVYNVTRNIGVNQPTLPTKKSIEDILKISDYTTFTLALEGWKPYGAHNQVHVYVGGTMEEMYSPADPVFWLNHAEIDRIWAIWQATHANGHPSLIGQPAIMDPWAYRYKDIAVTTELGYNYEETQL